MCHCLALTAGTIMSSSTPSSDPRYLAKTFLRGSAVLQAVSGHFRSSSSSDIVFGKETSIELVIIDKDGIIQSICDQPVFGKIKDLAVLPGHYWKNLEGKDLLLVLSDYEISFLFLCIYVEVTRNVLHVLKWIVGEGSVQFMLRSEHGEPLAQHIVEVPHSNGFALLFRPGDILLLQFTACALLYEKLFKLMPMGDTVAKSINIQDAMDMNVQPGSNYVCSWSWKPGAKDRPRIIFSVDSGELYAMEFYFKIGNLGVTSYDFLRKTFPCNALLWLEGEFVVAIADMADGMVLKFKDGSLEYRSSIQNIAPILDTCIVDCPDEKHGHIFSCSGIESQGSLRVIRSGISVETLLRTDPSYKKGVTGTWTIKLEANTSVYSLLVLSFVEQTRALSVGATFTDVTASVGFKPDVCTLACGIVGDGAIVQIYQSGVQLFVPRATLPKAISLSPPICKTWCPDDTTMTISHGAVGQGTIVVATFSPCFLFILGVRHSSTCQYELYQIHREKLQNELSCISIPMVDPKHNQVLMDCTSVDKHEGNLFVVGTHKPSVEIVSYTSDKGMQVLAVGNISTNTMGTTHSGCVPQDVKLVLVDRLYVLSGLRDGMLIRFEWPNTSVLSSTGQSCAPTIDSSTENPYAFTNSITSNDKVQAIFVSNTSGRTEEEFPVNLQLIAVRRIGITPVFLVSLSDS